LQEIQGISQRSPNF